MRSSGSPGRPTHPVGVGNPDSITPRRCSTRGSGALVPLLARLGRGADEVSEGQARAGARAWACDIRRPVRDAGSGPGSKLDEAPWGSETSIRAQISPVRSAECGRSSTCSSAPSSPSSSAPAGVAMTTDPRWGSKMGMTFRRGGGIIPRAALCARLSDTPTGPGLATQCPVKRHGSGAQARRPGSAQDALRAKGDRWQIRAERGDSCTGELSGRCRWWS